MLLVADLDLQKAYNGEIYHLNKRLLSARSHCATVEVHDSECPDGEDFEDRPVSYTHLTLPTIYSV